MNRLEEVAAKVNASGLACRVGKYGRNGEVEILGAEELKPALGFSYFSGIPYRICEEGEHLFASIRVGQVDETEVRGQDPSYLVAAVVAIVTFNSDRKS